jgi:N-hydroxyarylamine O-acetyltransferase
MQVDRYLARIGYDGPRTPDRATLAALQRAHLRTVPFDALDCLLGNPVSLAPEDAYRKVVELGRGGFCFELNGLFGELLAELGFPVTLVAARPFLSGGDPAPPFAHLALLVHLERRWLVDVGFGMTAIHGPLDVDDLGTAQGADGEVSRRIRADGAALVAENADAPHDDAYRFSTEPVPRAAFTAQCRQYATDPASVFVRLGPVVRIGPDGWTRVTRERVSTTHRGERRERTIVDEADWRRTLAREARLRVSGGEVRGTDGTAQDSGIPAHG